METLLIEWNGNLGPEKRLRVKGIPGIGFMSEAPTACGYLPDTYIYLVDETAPLPPTDDDDLPLRFSGWSARGIADTIKKRGVTIGGAEILFTGFSEGFAVLKGITEYGIRERRMGWNNLRLFIEDGLEGDILDWVR